jgi:hypothetical protein
MTRYNVVVDPSSHCNLREKKDSSSKSNTLQLKLRFADANIIHPSTLRPCRSPDQNLVRIIFSARGFVNDQEIFSLAMFSTDVNHLH